VSEIPAHESANGGIHLGVREGCRTCRLIASVTPVPPLSDFVLGNDDPDDDASLDGAIVRRALVAELGPRVVALDDVRRATGCPERLHADCVDQDTHGRRLAELAAAERERGEARAEVERLGYVLRTRIGDLERLLAEALDRWSCYVDGDLLAPCRYLNRQRITSIRTEVEGR
jgi:hypothetical protein